MPSAQLSSGTADVPIRTGSGRLLGWSIGESAGSAAVASLIIRDGVSASGAILAVIELAADASVTQSVGPAGIPFTDGLYVDRVTGSTQGAVWWV